MPGRTSFLPLSCSRTHEALSLSAGLNGQDDQHPFYETEGRRFESCRARFTRSQSRLFMRLPLGLGSNLARGRKEIWRSCLAVPSRNYRADPNAKAEERLFAPRIYRARTGLANRSKAQEKAPKKKRHSTKEKAG
jgi:hypothetical protein